MSTLYSIANALNYLVVGTDNQAELYTATLPSMEMEE